MAFLTTDEIHTHLYKESITAISDNDDTMLQMAIDTAISQAKGYLSAFDTDSIFDAEGEDRNPLLQTWCKDIAVWHFINIARPMVDFDVRKLRYEGAINWLEGVQSEKIVPDLPKLADDEATPAMIITSNPKRHNHI